MEWQPSHSATPPEWKASALPAVARLNTAAAAKIFVAFICFSFRFVTACCIS
jgi:hypothetical protein